MLYQWNIKTNCLCNYFGQWKNSHFFIPCKYLNIFLYKVNVWKFSNTNPLKTCVELGCFGRVGSSCCTCDARCIAIWILCMIKYSSDVLGSNNVASYTEQTNCQTTLNPAKQQERWTEELWTGICYTKSLYIVLKMPLSCIEY